MKRDRYYFIALNLIKNKHKNLIKWLKESADKQDRSLSNFCINILKKAFKEDIEWTDTEKE